MCAGAKLGLICLDRRCRRHRLLLPEVWRLVHSCEFPTCLHYLLYKWSFPRRLGSEILLLHPARCACHKLPLLDANYFLLAHDHAVIGCQNLFLQHTGTIDVDGTDALEHSRSLR